MKYWSLVFILLMSLVFPAQSARRGQRIEVKGALKKQLNQVLKDTSLLQQARVSRNKVKVSSSIRQLLKSLRVAQHTSQTSIKHRTHLFKMLSHAKANLEMAQMNKEKEKSENLKIAFKQLVLVAKTYNVDKYRIFFCSRDKGIWLQKSWRPENPISPDKFKNCGKLVPQ